MSDYLVFSRMPGSFMCIVEIKSGKFKTAKVISQLANGARHALLITKKLPSLGSRPVLLVLVADRAGSDLDQKRLQHIVRVNGLKCKIYPCPCGSRLANIVKNPPCSK